MRFIEYVSSLPACSSVCEQPSLIPVILPEIGERDTEKQDEKNKNELILRIQGETQNNLLLFTHTPYYMYIQCMR